MIDLTEQDKRLLELIQTDFPLVSRPYKLMGEKLNLNEKEIITKIKSFIDLKIIRDISTILFVDHIGFKTTLVAVKTNKTDIDSIAAKITMHTGVSHNYERNHDFNIWFTLAIPEEKDFHKEIKSILSKTNYIEYLFLPAIKTFKIGVNFRFDQKKYDSTNSIVTGEKTTIKLSESDKKLLVQLQENLQVIEKPFELIAKNIGVSEKDVLEQIEYLKKNKIIKRLSAALRHRNLGISFNGMTCFIIDENKIEHAGKLVSEHSQVTHCYQRPSYKDWPYTLFAMVHATSEEECKEVAKELADKINCTDYQILYSSREFKKERVKYKWDS